MSIKCIVASFTSIGGIALLTLVVVIRISVYYIPYSYILATLSLAIVEVYLIVYIALVLEVVLKSNTLRV